MEHRNDSGWLHVEDQFVLIERLHEILPRDPCSKLEGRLDIYAGIIARLVNVEDAQQARHIEHERRLREVESWILLSSYEA